MNKSQRETERPMSSSHQRRRGRGVVWLATAAAIVALAAGAWWAARVFDFNTGTRGQNASSQTSSGGASFVEHSGGDMPSIGSVMIHSPLVVLGRMGRAAVGDDEPHVHFTVETVLKGAVEEKELRIEDRLPIYRESGPPAEPLSDKFAQGTRVILFCCRHRTKLGALRVETAMEPTRRFLDIYEISQGVQPVEKLPDIVSAGTWFDRDVYVSMNLFTNERMALGLMGVFEANTQSRRETFQAEQTPQPTACMMELEMASLLQKTLPAEEQPRWFDAILDRLELAIDEDAGRPHATGRYGASLLVGQLPPSYSGFSEERLARLRELLIDVLEDCTAVDSVPRLDSNQPQVLGRVADRETIDFLLAEQARRPITFQHGHIAAGLAAALEVADDTDRMRILDAWRETFAEMTPLSADRDRSIRQSHFAWAIISALGTIADPGGAELLLDEQARRPITERHSRLATGLALAAERLPESVQQRIQQSWIDIVRELKPPLDRPQQEFVANVALFLTEKPFTFGPDEEKMFRSLLQSMPEKHYRSEVEEALRKVSEQ